MNGVPCAFSTRTTCMLNPHCGALGVPFMNSTTSLLFTTCNARNASINSACGHAHVADNTEPPTNYRNVHRRARHFHAIHGTAPCDVMITLSIQAWVSDAGTATLDLGLKSSCESSVAKPRTACATAPHRSVLDGSALIIATCLRRAGAATERRARVTARADISAKVKLCRPRADGIARPCHA